MEVDYDCKEINGKRLCFGKTCPIAEYKPPTLPKNVQECILASKEATEVLQYMIVNNPELIRNAKSLKDCIELQGKPDKKVEEICFNQAIGDIDKAKTELEAQGYKLTRGTDGKDNWYKASEQDQLAK